MSNFICGIVIVCENANFFIWRLGGGGDLSHMSFETHISDLSHMSFETHILNLSSEKIFI